MMLYFSMLWIEWTRYRLHSPTGTAYRYEQTVRYGTVVYRYRYRILDFGYHLLHARVDARVDARVAIWFFVLKR
jgi:hypothetical protein